MKPEPIRIEPIFSERIWGARTLAPLFPNKTGLNPPIGEAWSTGMQCLVASGPFASKSLGAMWREMPLDWRGANAVTPEFPLLVKFIFPNDKLSIQVHPDDDYATAHELAFGGRGKTEMWHALSAQAGAQVLVGLRPGTGREEFLKSLSFNTVEQLFKTHSVFAGDTFYVPAGTPHTIGAGMVLCEVQEYSDLTYRVYDYGRLDSQGHPRELHVEKALAVINFDSNKGAKVTSLSLPTSNMDKKMLAACRYFATERWEFSGPCEVHTDPAHFDVFVILSGSGSVQWQGGSASYSTGGCWLVPAVQKHFTWVARERTALLRAYLPNLAALRAELIRSGHSHARIEQAVFD